jgi:hypothetical protein
LHSDGLAGRRFSRPEASRRRFPFPAASNPADHGGAPTKKLLVKRLADLGYAVEIKPPAAMA